MNTLVRHNTRFPDFFQRVWDNEFFDDFLGGGSATLPAVNVVEKDDQFCLDVSIPGFKKEDIDVQVEQNRLTISAKHEGSQEQRDENDKVIRQEFSSSSFERSFTLPENIDTENIHAKQENGILKISLPKMKHAHETAVKKIELS